MANKKSEWHQQWSMFEDSERFLFEEWISPVTLADFRGREVLECGCGGGQHTSFVAPYARTITAVDLNTADIAAARNHDLKNATFMDADIAKMDLGRQFDVVLCIGVIHHTDDPDATFRNLVKHCKPGGQIIVWTYSAEGNSLVRYGLEPIRNVFLKYLSREAVLLLAKMTTLFLYPIVHTIYRIPILSFLPYFEYFANFRRLNFKRNVLNVFDKMNAPQTKFTTRSKCEEWFSGENLIPGSISIRRYAGVSYSLSGSKRDDKSY